MNGTPHQFPHLFKHTRDTQSIHLDKYLAFIPQVWLNIFFSGYEGYPVKENMLAFMVGVWLKDFAGNTKRCQLKIYDAQVKYDYNAKVT